MSEHLHQKHSIPEPAFFISAPNNQADTKHEVIVLQQPVVHHSCSRSISNITDKSITNNRRACTEATLYNSAEHHSFSPSVNWQVDNYEPPLKKTKPNFFQQTTFAAINMYQQNVLHHIDQTLVIMFNPITIKLPTTLRALPSGAGLQDMHCYEEDLW
jgi:hypothetical protein